ncbi:MAG: AAA family ATPase [Roseiflexaceae bacterium]|nr:AAA family ATPase [Roseiflexaceae bacterium]
MFQRLDELQTGSMYILTGQAGAGKSHLAASARRTGTLWVLDTEGAAQNLAGKPGIHRRIQVMQSLSLRTLIGGMEEIKSAGKAGDTILLDSISKVFQAMRAHAQRRAGGETDRKTGIGFDEHASVNRNMQAVYTALTELKQAGFHVIIIGHLGRKYRVDDTGMQDEGLRVLADDQIAYEADAILLVEREGDERSITPIIKPPRPVHLKLHRRYPATLATIYPDQVPDGEKAVKGRKGDGAKGRVSDSAAAHPDGEESESDAEPTAQMLPEQVASVAPAIEEPRAVRSEAAASPNRQATQAAGQPPRDPVEAEQRFFARYAEAIGGTTWGAVQRFLESRAPRPTTVEGWISVAEQVRERSRRDGHAARAA